MTVFTEVAENKVNTESSESHETNCKICYMDTKDNIKLVLMYSSNISQIYSKFSPIKWIKRDINPFSKRH